MKNLFSIVFILSFYTIISAQDDILFESTLYFEDAIGNKDSIVYGFAENEEINFINPIYGEEEIDSPFDSIFEVRASHDKNGRKPYTKKIITHVFNEFYDFDYNCFHNATRPHFVIHAKHYPVKISWNRNDFIGKFCVEGSMLVGNNRPFTFDFWFNEPSFLVEAACMALDSFVYRLEDGIDYAPYETQVDIEGNQTAIAKLAFILFRDDDHFGGLCKSEKPNSVSNTANLPILFPYPNPVGAIYHFGLDQAHTYEIIDLNGSVVLKGHHTQVDVQDLSNGIYFLMVEGYAPKRFVKL